MKTLEQYLDNCSASYYAGNPVITDEVFDALADSIGYNKVGSPQQLQELKKLKFHK